MRVGGQDFQKCRWERYTIEANDGEPVVYEGRRVEGEWGIADQVGSRFFRVGVRAIFCLEQGKVCVNINGVEDMDTLAIGHAL